VQVTGHGVSSNSFQLSRRGMIPLMCKGFLVSSSLGSATNQGVGKSLNSSGLQACSPCGYNWYLLTLTEDIAWLEEKLVQVVGTSQAGHQQRSQSLKIEASSG
jgi:hypothetical protein